MRNRSERLGIRRRSESRKEKISWENRNRFSLDSSTPVIIEFGTVKKLRDFINHKDEICEFEKSFFKIITIKRFKHTSMLATVAKITLREYNLERLLS